MTFPCTGPPRGASFPARGGLRRRGAGRMGLSCPTCAFPCAQAADICLAKIKNACAYRGALCAGGRCGIMDMYEQNERKDPPEYYFAASPARRADRGDLLVAFARLRRGDDVRDPARRGPRADRPGACVHGGIPLSGRVLRLGAFSRHGAADGAAAPLQVSPHRVLLQRHHPLVQRRAAL